MHAGTCPTETSPLGPEPEFITHGEFTAHQGPCSKLVGWESARGPECRPGVLPLSGCLGLCRFTHGWLIWAGIRSRQHRGRSLKQLVTQVAQGFLKGDLHGSSSLSGSLANSCVTQQAIRLFKEMSSKMDTSTLKSLMASIFKKKRDFPSGPVTKTPSSQCRGPRFDPWSES